MDLEQALGTLWESAVRDPNVLALIGVALEGAFRWKREADRACEAALGATRFASKGDVEAVLFRLDLIEERLAGLDERLAEIAERLGSLATPERHEPR